MMNKKTRLQVVMILSMMLLIPSLATAFGNITVSSVPSGATVIIDGVTIGATTPATIEMVSSGSHYISLKLSGYQDYAQNIIVSDNTTSMVSVTMTALQSTSQPITNGSINVESDPSNAAIFLNTEYQGRTPLTVYNLAPGTYRVLVQKIGYYDWSDRISVTAGVRKDVYAALDIEATDTPVVTTVSSTTTAKTTTISRTSTAKVPTPWPSSTPASASSMSVLAIAGVAGVGFVLARK
jgi:hypothetical protein